MRAVKQTTQRATIADVKRMIASGTSISTAIKEALSKNGLRSVVAFALKYRLNRAQTSNHLSGLLRASDATVEALISELDGTADEWRELLWLAGKPAVNA